jgi:carboxymethylenebutenolidase
MKDKSTAFTSAILSAIPPGRFKNAGTEPSTIQSGSGSESPEHCRWRSSVDPTGSIGLKRCHPEPVYLERVVLGTGSDRATAGSAGAAARREQPTSSFALRGIDEMESEGTLSNAWDQHRAAEFAEMSADQALSTMIAEPHVNMVPLMIGARGRAEPHDFYANHFLNQLPPDLAMVTVSRTVGQGRVVDELVARFTHSIRMDWTLPGVAPTGKRVEFPFVVVVQFEGDRLAHEHLYWDQASVLLQLGLLDRTPPVRGGEIAAQMLSPTQPMNELIHRASNENR